MNKVLIVYPHHDIEHTTNIFDYLLPFNVSIKDAEQNEGSVARVRHAEHTLETKYYKAELHFTVLPIIEDNEKSFVDQIDAHRLNCSEQNAIILVFKDSFTLLREFSEFLTDKGISFDTSLIVSTKNYISDTVRTWCIENSFEWVGDDMSQIDDDRNTSGPQRVVEALSCTMWPNMIKKDLTTNSSSSKEVQETSIKKKQEDLDLEEEQNLEDMDNLLAAMLKLRNEGHKLDHEQRKKEAAILATKLYEMFGDEDGSDIEQE